MLAVAEDIREQIDRILDSETLRSADGLRRLLSFLADKAIAGEADELKEYSIGVDAFGKPSTYDPRQDSTVRIQAGRLRQKLSEYYQSEGKDDRLIVELPKGHYRLNWQPRPSPVALMPGPVPVPAVPARQRRRWGVAAVAFVLLVVWAGLATFELWKERRSTAAFDATWSPELAELWQPILSSDRPVLIALGMPMFVYLPGYGLLNDPQYSTPLDVAKSDKLTDLSNALKLDRKKMLPSHPYASLGAAHAAFLLGRTIGARKSNISTTNGSELSARQMAENNVLMVGPTGFFRVEPKGYEVLPELTMDPTGAVQNLHPRGQEPAVFKGEFSGLQGTTHTLVSLLPGPNGNTTVMYISGRVAVGTVGASEWYTDPANAAKLVAHLRGASGKIPRYYQVLFRVKYQDRIPIETTYVLHRELKPAPR